MPKDERKSPPPAEAELAHSEAHAPAEFPSSLTAAGDPPPQADAEALVQASRFLQKRIPGFTQLTLKEKQALGRASGFDPDFADGIIRAAGVWDEAKVLTGHDADDFRDELLTTKEWDDAIREWKIVIQGMENANLRRKHALGQAMLRFYAILGATLNHTDGDDDVSHLRPYLEDLQKTLARGKKKGKGKKKNE